MTQVVWFLNIMPTRRTTGQFVKAGPEGTRGFQEIKASRFRDKDTGWW